ncbi:MAG: hypothetical protein MRY83_01505 [Flavobacteriales bacterium]|nr:hypothetical protein [Flavobacteriales bacterium]
MDIDKFINDYNYQVFRKYLHCFNTSFKQSLLVSKNKVTYKEHERYSFNVNIYQNVSDSKLIVNVNRGVTFSLMDIIQELIAIPGFWKEFEIDSNKIIKIRRPQNSSKNRFVDYSEYNLVDEGFMLFPISTVILDARRNQLGYCLACLCSNFIAYHEISHFLSGHIHFVNTLFGTQHYEEFDKPLNVNWDNDYYLSMEVQADYNGSSLAFFNCKY